MKTIVISDIHGYFDEFISLLKKTEYQPGKDQLYLLGDYVDKGKQSKDVIQFIKDLSRYEGVKIIGGNHDDMFLNWLECNDYPLSPYTNERNSGTNTILSFAPWFEPSLNDEEVRRMIIETYNEEILFLKSLPYYIEDEHHIYVHAGIDPTLKNWKDTTPKKFRWIRGAFYQSTLSLDKTVVFGHTCTAVLRDNMQDFSIWFQEGKIGIDGGAKFGGQLNALIIENGVYSSLFVEVDKRR